MAASLAIMLNPTICDILTKGLPHQRENCLLRACSLYAKFCLFCEKISHRLIILIFLTKPEVIVDQPQSSFAWQANSKRRAIKTFRRGISICDQSICLFPSSVMTLDGTHFLWLLLFAIELKRSAE